MAGVEAAPAGGGVVLGQDGFDHGALGQCFTGLGRALAVGFVVVHVEAQDVLVFDGVGDGVFVQGLLEQIFGSFEGLLVTLDAFVAGVLLEDRRASEAKQLRVGEELFDGPVVVAKLRAVAFVEDEHDALVAQRFELIGVGG